MFENLQFIFLRVYYQYYILIEGACLKAGFKQLLSFWSPFANPGFPLTRIYCGKEYFYPGILWEVWAISFFHFFPPSPQETTNYLIINTVAILTSFRKLTQLDPLGSVPTLFFLVLPGTRYGWPHGRNRSTFERSGV
jgi:hypothetical protein